MEVRDIFVIIIIKVNNQTIIKFYYSMIYLFIDFDLKDARERLLW